MSIRKSYHNQGIYHKIKNNLYIHIKLFYRIIKREEYEKLISNHKTKNRYHNKL